jgi:hypothetical protein
MMDEMWDVLSSGWHELQNHITDMIDESGVVSSEDYSMSQPVPMLVCCPWCWHLVDTEKPLNHTIKHGHIDSCGVSGAFTTSTVTITDNTTVITGGTVTVGAPKGEPYIYCAQCQQLVRATAPGPGHRTWCSPHGYWEVEWCGEPRAVAPTPQPVSVPAPPRPRRRAIQVDELPE